MLIEAVEGAVVVFGVIVALRYGVCWHDGRPSLLPTTTDLEGQMVGPRWRCPDCGAEWPATFDRATPPVQKFTGYDETKSFAAAQRSNELARAKKTAEIRRAGLPLSSHDDTKLVPMARHRG